MLVVAQVFVSCGQHSAAERAAANAMRKALIRLGFDVYVAVNAQSIEDVNAGIIRQLKLSDYYVFVDFARERVAGSARGSVFTHQELALAYLLRFERVLLFQQTGVKLEGLLRYMGSNASRFDDPKQLATMISRAFRDREWLPDYSRHLLAVNVRFDGNPLPCGEGLSYFFYVDIANRRLDVPAFETTARLLSIEHCGKSSLSPARGPLKVGGAPAFEQTIWPGDHGTFDLLAIDMSDAAHICLNSYSDTYPIPTLVREVGKYVFHYAVLAREFPVHHFSVDVTVTGRAHTTSAVLSGGETRGQ